MAKGGGARRSHTTGAGWAYGLLGSVTSAISFTSIVVRHFKIGLSALAYEIISAYRAAVHPIIDFLFGWLVWLFPSLRIPDWFKDLFALSVVGAAGVARALFLHWRSLRMETEYISGPTADRQKFRPLRPSFAMVDEIGPPDMKRELGLATLWFVLLTISMLGSIAVALAALWTVVIVYDAVFSLYDPDQRRLVRGLVFTVLGGVLGCALFLMLDYYAKR